MAILPCRPLAGAAAATVLALFANYMQHVIHPPIELVEAAASRAGGKIQIGTVVNDCSIID